MLVEQEQQLTHMGHHVCGVWFVEQRWRRGGALLTAEGARKPPAPYTPLDIVSLRASVLKSVGTLGHSQLYALCSSAATASYTGDHSDTQQPVPCTTRRRCASMLQRCYSHPAPSMMRAQQQLSAAAQPRLSAATLPAWRASARSRKHQVTRANWGAPVEFKQAKLQVRS